MARILSEIMTIATTCDTEYGYFNYLHLEFTIMMRIPVALLGLILLFGCNSSNKYVISGSFKEKQDEEWIYLLKFLDSGLKIDSVKIVNGHFEFKGSVEFPEIQYLSYHPDITAEAFPFFLEPEELEIIIDPTNWYEGSIITGGTVNEEFKSLEEDINDEYFTVYLELCDAYPPAKEENRKIFNIKMKELQESIMEIRKDFILNNPTSPISIVYLEMLYYILPIGELEDILSSFPKQIQRTASYYRISNYFKTEMEFGFLSSSDSNPDEVSINNKFEPDSTIIAALVNQNPNKALYIDIWNTGCGPCKIEFPYSKKLYEKIDTSKVAFIYLCTSSKEDNWRKMIEEKNLKGQHYLLNKEIELKLFEEIGGERSYPRYVIVSRDGEIYNRNAPRPSSLEIEGVLKYRL